MIYYRCEMVNSSVHCFPDSRDVDGAFPPCLPLASPETPFSEPLAGLGWPSVPALLFLLL